MDEDIPIPPGGVTHIKLGPEVDELYPEWQDGPDDAYHDPAQPLVAYTAANTITIGRAAEPGADTSPILQAESDGCEVATFHHPEAQVGAMMHIGAEDVIDQAREMATELLEACPVLSERDTMVHIFCTHEYSTEEGVVNTGDSLKNFLVDEYGLDEERVKIVREVPTGVITMDLESGYTEGAPPDAEEATYTYVPHQDS
jgi:hypothetical protein